MIVTAYGQLLRSTFTGCAAQDMRVREGARACKLHEVDDRLAEAHHFLVAMLLEYHNPEQFRWSLNAFLQALRNVTWVLQKTMSPIDGFSSWYASHQERMRSDELLARFVNGRNVVVKQRNLKLQSRVTFGVFRERSPRDTHTSDVNPDLPSRVLLSLMPGRMDWVDEPARARGEQYGVDRDWFAAELGTGNAVDLCDDAWHRLAAVVESAHQFLQIRTLGDEEPHRRAEPRVRVLLQTDVQPELAEKWGWKPNREREGS